MNLEMLYTENRGLLYFWAKRYAWLCAGRADIDIEDLVNAGFFGLVDASKTYKRNEGSWTTWASFAVRRHMLEALGLRKRSGTCKCTSLDAPAYDDSDLALVDTIPDDSLPDMEEEIEVSDTARIIREAVEGLENADVRRTIKEYYFQCKTLKQIADEQGETVSTVRKLCGKGLRRLRQARSIRHLSPEERLDLETRFHAHKGVTAFWNTHSSVVEDAVILREKILGNRKA